jgi:G3E family GTPase
VSFAVSAEPEPGAGAVVPGAGMPLIETVVLGGYLGAGKTTLLNDIIRGADHRTAVIVNDFGALGIDQHLIERFDGTTVTLANGCICCSVADGLAAALADLNEVRPRPSRLLIEASGVADPSSVAAYAHRPGFHLDLVVVLVDGERFAAQVNDPLVGDAVVGQLRAADVVVINKIDLIGPAQRDAVEAQVRTLVADRPVIMAEHGRVPVELFDLPDRFTATPAQPEPGEGTALLVHGLESWHQQWSGPIGLEALTRHVNHLDSGVIRLKGIVETDQGWVVVHRVGERTTLSDARPVEASCLVAIGHPGAITETALLPERR